DLEGTVALHGGSTGRGGGAGTAGAAGAARRARAATQGEPSVARKGASRNEWRRGPALASQFRSVSNAGGTDRVDGPSCAIGRPRAEYGRVPRIGGFFARQRRHGE